MTGGYHSARDHDGDLELDADVVVVGSGAGGSVVATELATAGQRVLVLEEGPRVPPADYGRMRPSESMRHIWRDGGMTVALGVGDTPSINVTMGRCVGGSSVLTGAVCFRIPDEVLHEWSNDHGLAGYTPAEMEPFAEHVEKAIHVEEVPVHMRSRGTQLFAEGAAKRGVELQPLRRNTKGCQGCGRCNFGCPHEAKMSVDQSYLPRAVRAGADVWSHCRVDRVRVKNGRAVGVVGRVLGRPGGKPSGRLAVHARRVVVACGAWNTPVLLQRSGIRGGGHVGRHLTVHPAFRGLARFDEPVRGWQGALQSAYTEAFRDDGITLTGLFVPVGVLGATMPGVGPEHTRAAANIDQLAIFGGMIHDDGGGRVHRIPGRREPLVTYRMSKKDRATVPKVVRLLAEIFADAGAKEIFLPVLGMRPVAPDDLASLDLDRIPGSRFECSSQHPLGTCRMSAAPERGVVDADGKSWEVDELYVADGSVLPTSLGVNPQLSIMTVATRIAWRMTERA
ncbi:MAG: GMC family oxidoreductase N-terminal domain-containing protein [Myxococcota bacterium]